MRQNWLRWWMVREANGHCRTGGAPATKIDRLRMLSRTRLPFPSQPALQPRSNGDPLSQRALVKTSSMSSAASAWSMGTM